MLCSIPFAPLHLPTKSNSMYFHVIFVMLSRHVETCRDMSRHGLEELDVVIACGPDQVRFHELLSAGLKACVALRNVPSARFWAA